MEADLIPYKPLSDAEKEKHLEVMRRGNRILRDKFNQCRKLQAKRKEKCLSRSDFRIELFKQLNGHPKAVWVRGVHFSFAEAYVILAVRQSEWPMLQAHANLLLKLTNGWQNKAYKRVLGRDDFYHEGVLAMIESLYGFTKSNIVFSTYVYRSITRRFINLITRHKPLARWSNKAMALWLRYRKEVRKVNGPVTFDEVAKTMKLTTKEITVLQGVLRKVAGESELTQGQNEIEGHGNYADKVEAKPQAPVLDDDQRKAIAAANLTEWEKVVLEAFMNSGTGWKTEVAANHINPRTGKPYSRQAPINALASAKKKILQAYKKAA